MTKTELRKADAAIRRFRRKVAELEPDEVADLPNYVDDNRLPIGVAVEIGPRGGLSRIRVEAGHWDGSEWHTVEVASFANVTDDDLIDSIEIAIQNEREQAAL